MPDWILAPVCAVFLVGFILYAFRQGMKVKPDRNNKDFGSDNGALGGDPGSPHDGGGHSF